MAQFLIAYPNAAMLRTALHDAAAYGLSLFERIFQSALQSTAFRNCCSGRLPTRPGIRHSDSAKPRSGGVGSDLVRGAPELDRPGPGKVTLS